MPACFNDPVFGQTLFASIGGGGENRINDACTSFIGGGDFNHIQPVVGSGATVCRSFIGGGVTNCIFESVSVIGGGEQNTIHGASEYSFIGGGYINTIGGQERAAPYSVIGGGRNNNIFDDVNVIGGGQENTISAGAQHSFIGGGISNVINASCGAILGGQNNTVNHAYAAVFGNGISSAAADTFHVSCLNAVNTPNSGLGPFPAGTISYTPTPILPPGAVGFLVIW